MDARSLQELWQGPSPFLAQMGKGAFDLAQEKQQADLATTLGLEQRNQAMHPAELAGKQAVTRLNNSTAAMNEDVLASNIPAAQRQKQRLQESLSKMDDVTRTQLKARVIHNLQLANAMKKNKGQLPEGFSLSPEEAPYFTPDKLDAHIAYGQAFMEMDPEEIPKRQRAAEAERLAQVRGQLQMDVKTTPGAGGRGSVQPSLELPKTYGEIVAAMAKYKRASERIAYLKSVLPGLPEQLQLALQPSYAALKKQADAEANARLAGEVDIAGATKGKVPVNPAVDLGDAPGAVTARPQRQEATQRITIYKDGKAVGTIPAEQKAQALQQGYTVK